MVLSRDSSIRIASRSSGNDIGPESWYAVAGGEAGYIEADPTNADITYGGEYDGQLSSSKKKTGQGKISLLSRIEYWLLRVPKNTVFNGRTIVFASQPKRMYVTSQVVHVTEDQGHSFEIISPDLSEMIQKLQEKQADQSQRIKQEQKYATIFTLSDPWKKGNLDRIG
jgi:hypothetical protein